jgi:peptidoglycan/xylan/chitin deacetylase (PgdA/CDA1 family)
MALRSLFELPPMHETGNAGTSPGPAKNLGPAVYTKHIKRILLYLARALGAFRLSRYLTRRQLRILCYHGFSVGNEFRLLPGMFMRAETFSRRMAILERLAFPVISLDDAVDKLKRNLIGNSEVAITFDDGWASNLSIAYPILKSHRFPAAIYVTTEHLAYDTEAFNVVLHYLFLSSPLRSVTFEGIHPVIDGHYDVKPNVRPAVLAIIGAATQHLSLGERQARLGKIAAALGSDIDTVIEGDRFRLLKAAQIAELSREGVAIELHTHTHNLPTESAEAMRAEITQNRDAIEAITGKRAQHFCYPSGVHSEQHPEWLSAIGIKSATTCEPGLNDSTTDCLLLRRYLDQEGFSDIEFESWVTGFAHLVRRILKRS